jgi:serine/threonine protein kinase/Flp pilus assembly protein TadD
MSRPSPDVKSVFGRAAEIATPSGRAAFLEEACAGHPAVRAEVEELLNALGNAGSFMGRPAAPADETAAYAATMAEGEGTIIGPYKLMEQIGEGGMGLVFVAEQHQPVRRKVALKIIKPGMDTRQVVARFEAERQALAMMDHPHIAKVLDAGTTDSGRPYFVMELVRGVPITEYCDANHLTPRERLGLFIQVCQAVQHAHLKGVIHRDLKPSNILVAPHDGVPVVKVIDFGVAKALGQQLTEKTIYTRFAQMIGTPLYMSPEQAEVNQLDVDTRSDVYSLGVLLYELLTGTTPFDQQRFQKAAFDEIRRIIKEEDPPKPSTRLTALGATLTAVSAQRGTDPARLSKLVRGELDWIVMRCLEKDRTRRYETVAGLAKDVQHYLNDEAVEARPASVWYRLSKTYRRNRAVVLTATGFALILVVGLLLVTWKWRAERAARADADVARRDAESKAREIQQGAERMNAANAAIELAGQHALLGQWVAAEAAHNRAIALRPDHSQVWMQRGELYGRMGLWDLALQDYARSFNRRPPESVVPWYQYALLCLLQGDEAGHKRTCGQMLERFGGSSHGYVRGTLNRACSLIPDAVADYDQRAGLHEIKDFPRHVLWLGLYGRGLSHYRAGRYPEAVLDLRESLSRTAFQSRALNYPILAMALHRSGQTDAARQELENSRRELDRYTEQAFNNQSLYREGLVPWQYWYDWVEFLTHHAEAHRLIEQAPLPDDPRRRVLRGRAFAALDRPDQAAPEYAHAVRLAPNAYPIRLETFRFQVHAQRWAEAESTLTVIKNLRPKDPNVSVAAFRTFAANGRWDRAAGEHAAAIKLRPDDLNVLLEQFRYHDERGEANEAEAAYAEATKARANDIPFRIKLGDACAGLRQWAKARDEYARVLDAGILGDGSLNRNAWLRLAVLQLYFGEVDDYRRTCVRLVERHGTDTDRRTIVTLIRLCLLHPDPGVAPARLAELYERANRQAGDSERERDLNLAAIIALRTGKDDVNMDALQAALNRYQWDTQRIALARVHHARGFYFGARTLINQVRVESRKVDPTAGPTGAWEINVETQLWYRQAEALIQPERWRTVDELVRQQQWAAAIDALGPLLKPEDKFAGDWGTRATCYEELGRWKEAAADSAHAHALAPDYLPGVLKYGLVCLQVGDRDRYLSLCRRALKLHAASTERSDLNSVAWLCALDAAAEKEAVQGLVMVEKAQDQAPNNSYAQTRACLLYRVGRYDDALKQLNELVAQPGRSATAYDWLFLALTHHRLGQHEQARNDLDQAVTWLTANDSLDWQKRAELERFRTEAEALIREKR